jgi:hypothetical protein
MIPMPIRKLLHLAWQGRTRFVHTAALLAMAHSAMAQSPKTEGWAASPGVLGTAVLWTVVLLLAALILMARADHAMKMARNKRAARRNGGTGTAHPAQAEPFRLRGDELGGTTPRPSTTRP